MRWPHSDNLKCTPSYTFNDRYPLTEAGGKKLNDIYQYLGLKSTTNSLFISRPQRDTIDNLTTAIKADKNFSPLRLVFKELGLKPTLGFFYKPSRNFSVLFDENINFPDRLQIDRFKEAFYRHLNNRKIKDIGERIRFGEDKYEKVFSDNELMNRLLNYLQRHVSQLTTAQIEKEYSFTIDFGHESSYDKYLEHAITFQILQDLEIFSFDRFDLTKYGKAFAFDNASSGEYHLLFIFINILSFIEPDALVLIDEPEISLHPNWQLQFMSLMHTAFKSYPTTQFIVCTHSHFVVSDLHPENSNIVSLNFDRDTKQIKARSIEKNTFAWSAEQILLEVFEVPTTRNFYLSAKITEILELMARPETDRNQINQKLQELHQYDFSHLSDADPFKTIINKLLSVA